MDNVKRTVVSSTVKESWHGHCCLKKRLNQYYDIDKRILIKANLFFFVFILIFEQIEFRNSAETYVVAVSND